MKTFRRPAVALSSCALTWALVVFPLVTQAGPQVVVNGSPAAPQTGTADMRSVWTGIYTEAQAERGNALYRDNCEHCHGTELQGDVDANTQSLAGPEFLKSRDGSSVGALYRKILTAMPDDDPATMTPGEVADIVAFILKFNKIPGATTELPADYEQLKLIRMDAVRPK